MLYLLVGLLLVFAGIVLGRASARPSPQLVHVTREPLPIASPTAKGGYVLPPGTTLYFDYAMAEGHSIYHVYIQAVEKFPLVPEQPPGAIVPISAGAPHPPAGAP